MIYKETAGELNIMERVTGQGNTLNPHNNDRLNNAILARLKAENNSYSPQTDLFCKACKYIGMGALIGLSVSLVITLIVGLSVGVSPLIANAAVVGTVALTIIGIGGLAGPGFFYRNWTNTGVEAPLAPKESYGSIAEEARALAKEESDKVIKKSLEKDFF